MSILASVFLLQAAAAAPATATLQPAAPADDKKTCKTIKASGSRLGGTRLCLSKEGWRKFEESRDATRFKDSSSSRRASSQ